MTSLVLSFFTSKMGVSKIKKRKKKAYNVIDWAEIIILSHLFSSLPHPDLNLSLTPIEVLV